MHFRINMKNRRIVIAGTIAFLVLVLAALLLRYQYIQDRSAFSYVSASGEDIHCLFEQPLTVDLTLVAYRDERQCAYVKIVQKGLLNDYSCGVTWGGYPLIDTENRTNDSIKENDYLRIGANELSRDPGRRHPGKVSDKMLLVWGIVYDDTVRNVEVWGNPMKMIALPGYSSRICYFVTDDYDENFTFAFGDDDKSIVVNRW